MADTEKLIGGPAQWMCPECGVRKFFPYTAPCQVCASTLDAEDVAESERRELLEAAAPDLYEALLGMKDWALQQFANALADDDADVSLSDKAHLILSALSKATPSAPDTGEL